MAAENIRLVLVLEAEHAQCNVGVAEQICACREFA
jgi:hypothetical protein